MKMKLVNTVTGKEYGNILTNRILEVWEAAELLNVDLEAMFEAYWNGNGDDPGDLELFLVEDDHENN